MWLLCGVPFVVSNLGFPSSLKGSVLHETLGAFVFIRTCWQQEYVLVCSEYKSSLGRLDGQWAKAIFLTLKRDKGRDGAKGLFLKSVGMYDAKWICIVYILVGWCSGRGAGIYKLIWVGGGL